MAALKCATFPVRMALTIPLRRAGGVRSRHRTTPPHRGASSLPVVPRKAVPLEQRLCGELPEVQADGDERLEDSAAAATTSSSRNRAPDTPRPHRAPSPVVRVSAVALLQRRRQRGVRRSEPVFVHRKLARVVVVRHLLRARKLGERREALALRGEGRRKRACAAFGQWAGGGQQRTSTALM